MSEDEGKLIYPHESYLIMGAAFEVYNQLGPGFLEAVYQDALAYELGSRGISYVEQGLVRIKYKTIFLPHEYRTDFLVFDKIILELKAISQISPVECSQIYNYMKATGVRLGIVLNFGAPKKLEYKRIVLKQE